jgi:transposase-like protein
MPDKMNEIIDCLKALSNSELLIVKEKINALLSTAYQEDNEFNSYVIKNKTIICPNCNSANSIKYGHNSSHTQRYKCKNCNNIWTITNKTTIEDTKKKFLTWKDITDLINLRLSLFTISNRLNINIKTAYFYRHKIMHAISPIVSNTILSGRIEFDETFVHYNQKGNKDNIRNTYSKRGINNNLVSILVAIDEKKHILVKVLGRVHITTEELVKAIQEHINVQNSYFVSDDNPSYDKISKILGIEHKKFNSKETEAKKELYLVNNICSLIKLYYKRFKGVMYKNLQRYLDWFVFTNNYKEKNYLDIILVYLNSIVFLEKRLLVADLIPSLK